MVGIPDIAAVGLEIEVTILEVQVPATFEANMGGTIGAGCTSLQVITKAGSGVVKLFVKTWATGRHDWKLYEWAGAEWVYPSEKTFVGSCAEKVGIPDPKPPELLDPMDSECQVVMYNGADGNAADPKYTYAVQAKFHGNHDITGATKLVLPQTIQDSTQSTRTFGNCLYVQYLDDDGFSQAITNPPNSNDAFMLGLGTYTFTNDLKEDVAAIGITTYNPKPSNWDIGCPQDKKTGEVVYNYEGNGQFVVGAEKGTYTSCPPWLITERPDRCYFMGFSYTDFVGLNRLEWSLAEKNFQGSNDMSSFRISRGCKRVWVKDNDYGGSQNDRSYYHSEAVLDGDIDNDIAKFCLYPKTAAGAEELQVSKDSTGSKEEPPEPTGVGVKQIKVKESGCWHCAKAGVANSMQCWKGQKGEVPGACGKDARAKIDPDCKCTAKQAKQLKKIPKRMERLNAQICDVCGFGYKKGSDKRTQCQSKCEASKRKGEQSVCPKDCLYANSDAWFKDANDK